MKKNGLIFNARLFSLIAGVMLWASVGAAQEFMPDYVERPSPKPDASAPAVIPGANLEIAPTGEPGAAGSAAAAKNEESVDGDKNKSVLPEDWKRLLATVAVVTGFLFVLMFLMKRMRPDCPRAMSREIFEVLGKGTLGFHQQVYMFRCGNKLFLVAISSLGVERIGEITDPVEVEFLTRTCRGELVTRNMFTQNTPAAQHPSSPQNSSASQSGAPTGGGVSGASGDPKARMSFDEIYQQVVSRHKNG